MQRHQLSIRYTSWRLKELLSMKPLVNAIEAHNGITGLIAENTITLGCKNISV